ncbi:hypothetical protein FZD47_25515 [Bacillus infantis]|uniref:Uncharacterized protein n=1 Tax=Bacillus infantis TaxID=324767 RepID=A0A5D4S1T4_9BACI|nr:AimR family lysis-lysogeny pheromone receptor [Bacillus infantis]TYS55786.1 hypothetical protein FZD47_25515 [Bacillus infantis]
MKKLMAKVKEEAGKRKIRYTVISKKLNVTTGMVSNYLNATNSISFFKFLELLNLIFEEENSNNKDGFIKEFFDFPQKTEYVKEAIEWSFVNGRIKQAAELLGNYEGKDDILTVYSLLLRRNQGSLSKEDYYKRIHELPLHSSDDHDLKTLWRIAQLYAILDFKGYSLVDFHTKEIENLIEGISNEFLAASFRLRIMEAAAYTSLRRNEVSKCRLAAIKAIKDTNEEMFPIPVSSIYNLLAESYVFENAAVALEYNKKALQIFNKSLPENVHRKRALEATADFIKIHSGDNKELFLSDPAERIHLLAMSKHKDENELALELLEKIEREEGELSPFQKYYKGLADKNIKTLLEAEEAFVLRGDIFYSYLPKLVKFR